MAGKEPKSEKPHPGADPDKPLNLDTPAMPSPLPGLDGSDVDIMSVAQGDEPTSLPPVPGGGKAPRGKDE